MEKVLTDFVKALRNSNVRVSPAETIDAVSVIDSVGYEDKELLKRTLSIVLSKTPDEKDKFNACFDDFFSDEIKQQASVDMDQLSDIKDIDSDLAKKLLEGSQGELMLSIADAAEEAEIREIRYFTQRSVFTRRILEKMGVGKLEDELMQLGSSREDELPSDLEQELRNQLTNLRERVSDYIFADQNLDPNRLYVIENTGSSSPAGYEGELEIDAYYASVEALISDQFRISAGARYEDGTQEINTYDLFTGKDNSIDKTIDEDYILPSLTLTYLPESYENLQIRFGYSETIARPTFRELSPTLFVDVDTDRVIAGSLYLENSEIENFDLRFEYYFDQNQFLTLGAFYKEIDKPIEESVTEIGDLVITSYQNVPLAEISGFEFEFERIFDGFESSWLASKELLMKVNYTFTDSEIVIGEGDTFVNLVGVTELASSLLANGRDSRLQGQSDNILNFQIGFNDFIANSQGTLIFNYVDDRVRARGIDVLPDIIEEVPTTLDFVYSRNFDRDDLENPLKLSLEIRNILDESYEATVADNIFYDQYDLGRSFSLGLKYQF